MKTVELGSEAAQVLAKTPQEYLPCIEANLNELAENPSLGRIAPKIPYGWWSGLIFEFNCANGTSRRGFTAFYLKADFGIAVHTIGSRSV